MTVSLTKPQLEASVAEKAANAENYRWDLSIFYSGLDDPQLDTDIAKLAQSMKEFNVQYKEKLAQALGKAIADYAEIEMLTYKIYVYLYLLQSCDVANSAVKEKMASAERQLCQAQGEYLTFFAIELAAIDNTRLERLYAADPIAAKHKPWIEHQRIFKPHMLTESVEGALTKRSPFGEDAWSEFFDELESDLEFDLKGVKHTLTEMIDILTESKDAAERFEAMRTINNGFKGPFAKYSAQTLYMVAGSKAVETKERGYRHPMDAQNKANRVPDTCVDALHDAVMDIAAPLMKRFYRLKAAHLGLEKLKWSDRNAPMPFADTDVLPFDEALAMVLEAYESFSPTLAGIIRRMIAEKRIDAPALKGRRDGAYNYSMVLPGNIPASFTFLNYLGSNRDAMVIAHELGHGVHGILATAEQGPLMCHAPTAYSETASVFGEMTTFNHLKKRLEAKGDIRSLLALVMDKLDDIINTSVRQIGFSNFERRLHGMDAQLRHWGDVRKLSVEQNSAIWNETRVQLYGPDGEVFTYENSDLMWSYISHFHRPFYVYGYAFGELLTHSLYAKREFFGQRFEPLYLDLLRAGSTKNAVELLEPFGLDPLKPEFWADGIRISLGSLLALAEKLSAEMGVTIA
jgi:oligoendopeptidase F